MSGSNTQVFTLPESGFTAEQIAEYDALKTTGAEWKGYGMLLKTGHPGSWVSVAQAGDGRSFNEIFGSPENVGHKALFASTRSGMSCLKDNNTIFGPSYLFDPSTYEPRSGKTTLKR
jgi:hypothetical protein